MDTTRLNLALYEEPESFEFFQAVRLLELVGLTEDPPRRSVGGVASPEQEAVRFDVDPSAVFATSDVSALEPPAAGGPALPTMSVRFLGLVGPSGTLPPPYTTHTNQSIAAKDRSFIDFLGQFDHRAISFFYRAWRKYRYGLDFEHWARSEGREDPFTRGLLSLMGLGTDGVRGLSAISDLELIGSLSHYANRTRTADGLERVLAKNLGVRARVLQFRGRWLRVGEEDRCRLGDDEALQSGSASIGEGAMLGGAYWDVAGLVEVRLGPVDLETFNEYAPEGAEHARLAALVESYLDRRIDWRLSIEVEAGLAVGIHLAGDGAAARPQLGRNTWLELRPTTESNRIASFAPAAT